MTSRINRGFHRVGIVLAVPFLCAALVTAIKASNNVVQLHGGLGEVANAIPSSLKAGDQRQCTHFDVEGKKSVDLTIAEIDTVLSGKPPICQLLSDEDLNIRYGYDYSVAILISVFALAIYVAARAIGWVLDGFMSPSRS